jgi:hypothetical protein
MFFGLSMIRKDKMHNKKQFINAVCILFSLCFIGCVNKKTQTAEFENAETNNAQEIELHSEGNELQDDETDDFQGEYFFSSYDSLEYENIDDVGKYIDLDETIYIKMIRIGEGRYIAESNYWLIKYGLEGRKIEYPNEWYYEFNYDERFKDRFGQISADGMYHALVVNLFYTGIGIVLYCEERNHEYEKGYEKEEIKYYLYFNKKNNEELTYIKGPLSERYIHYNEVISKYGDIWIGYTSDNKEIITDGEDERFIIGKAYYYYKKDDNYILLGSVDKTGLYDKNGNCLEKTGSAASGYLIAGISSYLIEDILGPHLILQSITNKDSWRETNAFVIVDIDTEQDTLILMDMSRFI